VGPDNHRFTPGPAAAAGRGDCAVKPPGPGREAPPRGSRPLREYLEVLAAIAAVTVAGWFAPVTYHVLGHVYLLVVIALSLRVGRWPVLFAAVLSAVAWNFVFIAPRFSLSVFDFDDVMILGTYFVVALIAGQLTARIRAQQQQEHLLRQRATALFHLTRALAGAHTLDEAVAAAVRQADGLFGASTALLLAGRDGGLAPHPAGSFPLDGSELAVAEWVWRHGREAGRFTAEFPSAEGRHLPLRQAGASLGVFAVRLPAAATALPPEQREFVEGFAAQIALLVEREQWRAAAERGKLVAESDRLHRTLLDSVSHELKTPLAVLRSAAENLGREEDPRRAGLTGEIRAATSRLEHLVANLLGQTRLEAGAVKPQPDWCDVRDIVSAARRALGESLAGRALRLEIPADLPLFMADAVLMEQVMANLLLNGVRHTPAGGPLTVTAGLDARGDRVFIAVADRGPGIPPEMRGQFFQKFQRGHGTPTGGLGLGLSIVRGFMLAQGGDVAADDNPGGGARFTVYLPHTRHETVPTE
jgi:two-component system sensor histidine kinase KdpD